MAKFFLTFISFFIPILSLAQCYDCFWNLDDSLVVNFSTGVPVVENHNINTNNVACTYTTSFWDTANNRLYFSNGVNIWNRDFEYLLGGTDTTPVQAGTFTQMRNVFIPFRTLNKTYWIRSRFHGVYLNNFIEVGVIDNTGDNGKGELVSRDTLLNAAYANNTSAVSPNPISGAFCVVKHGNGLDWWLIFPVFNSNTYITYLLQNDTFNGPYYQQVGDSIGSGGFDGQGQIQESADGTRICHAKYCKAVNVFDFDRFTGMLTLTHSALTSSNTVFNGGSFYEAEFSQNGNILYISNGFRIVQCDLTDPNWYANRTTIFTGDTTSSYGASMFSIKRFSDNKIYIGGFSNNLPVQSPNIYDNYLWRIDNPNIVGPSCGLDTMAVYLWPNQPPTNSLHFYINLLPYIPNYTLGELTSSGISQNEFSPQITLAPNPAQTQATLNWSGMQEGIFVLRDMLGRAVLSEQLNAPSGTTRLDLSTLPKGIYLWQVLSTTHTKNGKLVVE